MLNKSKFTRKLFGASMRSSLPIYRMLIQKSSWLFKENRICILGKRVQGMEIYFVNRKRVILSWSWLFLNEKSKGQRKATKRGRTRTPSKDFCMWSVFSKRGLNLIRQMAFIKIGWFRTGFGLALKSNETFPGMLLLTTDCVSVCAFKSTVFTFEIFFFILAQAIIFSQWSVILSDGVFKNSLKFLTDFPNIKF